MTPILYVQYKYSSILIPPSIYPVTPYSSGWTGGLKLQEVHALIAFNLNLKL